MVYKILLHLTENISFWPCILRYIYYMTKLISNYVLILFSFVLESSFIHIFIYKIKLIITTVNKVQLYSLYCIVYNCFYFTKIDNSTRKNDKTNLKCLE